MENVLRVRIELGNELSNDRRWDVFQYQMHRRLDKSVWELKQQILLDVLESPVFCVLVFAFLNPIGRY